MKPARYRKRSDDLTWHVRTLYFTGLLIVLPGVALMRLLPSRWYLRHEETVFAEANRVLLTAVGFALMA